MPQNQQATSAGTSSSNPFAGWDKLAIKQGDPIPPGWLNLASVDNGSQTPSVQAAPDKPAPLPTKPQSTATEDLDVTLPSGETITATIPGGMSDAEARAYMVSKRPDLFQTNPQDALSKAQGLSAGPGWLGQKWNEVKAGLAGAQQGGGLTQQPTALGNTAQFGGMAANQIAALGTTPEMFGAQNLVKAKSIMDTVEGALKNVPVDTSAGGNLIQKAAAYFDEVQHGLTAPPEITQFAKRFNAGEPITFSELRSFSKNLGEAARSIPKDKPLAVRGALDFKSAMDQELSRIADPISGGQWSQALQAFAKGSQFARNVKSVGKFALLGGAGVAADTLARTFAAKALGLK